MKALRALLAVVLFAGCGVLEPESEERRAYDDALATWKRLGVDNYSFVYQISCECLPEWQRPVRLIVRNGKVVDASDIENGTARNVDRFRTIDGLFARIKEALDDHAYRVEVEYDRNMHYPSFLFIDEDRSVADEEMTMRSSALQPLQP